MKFTKKNAKVKVSFLIITMIYIIVLSVFVAYCVLHMLEKQAIVQFKKEYAAYNQALMLTAVQMSGDTGCYYSSDRKISSSYSNCLKFYKKFASNLKVTKYCKKNALENGCVPKYNSYSTEARCAGYSESMMNRFNQVFVMDDRSNLIVYNYPRDVAKPMFAIDVNGNLKPNKSGYDLFSMVIMRNSSGNYYFYPDITYCLPVEKGGFHYLTDIWK